MLQSKGLRDPPFGFREMLNPLVAVRLDRAAKLARVIGLRALV